MKFNTPRAAMKLRSVILVILMIRLPIAYSQHAEVAFEAGFLAGKWELTGNASQYESKFRTGILASANKEIPVAPRMTIQAGLQYATFGSARSTDNQVTVYNASYLMLPVTARYDLGNGLSFMSGLQPGRLMRARQRTNEKIISISHDMRHHDLFLVLGAQHRSKHGFSAGIWYQHGLMNAETRTQSPLQNRGFGIEISYKPSGSLGDLIRNIFR